MKKCLLLVLSLISISISAQVIVGGGIDFFAASGGDKSVSSEIGALTKSPVDFSFGFTPKVGYLINNFEVGLGIGLQYNHTMNYEILYNKEIERSKIFKDYKDYTFDWSINPYARYRVVNAKGFGLWIEGVATLSTRGTEGRTYYAGQYGEDVLRTKEEAYKLNHPEEIEIPIKTSVFYGGLFIQPVLTYNINDNWRLETTLNFLGVNLLGNTKTIKNKETGEKISYNTCSFGFNVSTYNTFNAHMPIGLDKTEESLENLVATGKSGVDIPFLTIGVTYSIPNKPKKSSAVETISELATNTTKRLSNDEHDYITEEQAQLKKLEEEKLARESTLKYVEQIEKMHSIIVKNRTQGGVVYSRYLELYKGYSLNDDTAQTLINIQKVVMTYINTQEPEALKNELQKAQTNEETLNIFKKYANK